MSHSATRGTLAGALLAGMLLWCEPVLACSCIKGSVLDSYAQAVSVFEGHVLEILEPAAGPNGVPQSQRLKVRLSVVRAWKGMEDEQIEISTASSSAACGFTFEVDRNYLIYATGTPTGLDVSLCSRTRPIEQADEDVHVIGMGATPVNPRPPADEKSVNQTSAQPRPATKGGCATCTIGPAHHDATPRFATFAFVALLAHRARRRTRINRKTRRREETKLYF